MRRRRRMRRRVIKIIAVECVRGSEGAISPAPAAFSGRLIQDKGLKREASQGTAAGREPV